MGQISKGILGGFSGTVGTVVGGSWRGIAYRRSKPIRKKSFTPSPKQLDQQLKFGLVGRFVKSMASLVDFTFNDYAVKMTGQNSCVSYLLKNAIAGTSPLFAIDYTKVLISRGDGKPAQGATAASSVAGRVAFSWTNNSDDSGKAKTTDRAILVVHCPDDNQTVYTTTGATRSAGTQVVDVLPFSGKQVHTYMGFVSEDGQSIATSIYTGEVTVV